MATKVERVRGVNDILPNDYDFGKWIEDKLRRCFESFGYRPIEIPMIEYTDLYLRKSGEDIVSRLYDFTYQNRRLCLRPEMTASVVRAYVDSLQGSLQPVRVYYVGPVFRYEKPQRGTYRQFTQLGIELIGAAGSMADAEIIYGACKGLDLLGLSDYRIVVGHVGILEEFLQSLALESHLRSFLLTNMETLRREGKRYMAHRLHEIYPSFPPEIFEKNITQELTIEEFEPKDTRGTGKLVNLLRCMDEAEARAAILDLLESMNIALDGARDPHEIVDRLLTKMKRAEQTPRLNRALDFMSELGQLVGEPSKTLREAEKLLAIHKIDRSPLDQLHSTFETLDHYNLEWGRLSLDFGLSRGLQYYTGMIFEIHHGSPAQERQLCGGGRYDDLIITFGGRKETPAVGFSYGLERIRLALEDEGKILVTDQRPIDILVIPVSTDDYRYAISVAEQLRWEGLRVEIDVRDRSVTSNFQYADKRGIPFAIVVGSEERLTSQVVLKNMASREEKRITPDKVANEVERIRGYHE